MYVAYWHHRDTSRQRSTSVPIGAIADIGRVAGMSIRRD